MTTQPTTEHTDNRSPAQRLQQVILEKTEDGARIATFLLSVMDGELPDFQPHHRIQAAQILEKSSGIDLTQYIEASGIKSLPAPTRRERRDMRRADRRINSEMAEIVREKTDGGRRIVDFLLSAMEGEFPDFKPNHRMSACNELTRRGFDDSIYYACPGHAEEPAEEPAEEMTPVEAEYRRLRAESVEFSLHGELYYDKYTFPCPCEDRLHDCDGNLLSEEGLARVNKISPAADLFFTRYEQLEDYKVRYAEFLLRKNPGKEEAVAKFIKGLRWRKMTRDP